MMPPRSELGRILKGVIVAPPLGAGTYSALFAISLYGLGIAKGDAEFWAGLIGVPIIGLLGAFFGSSIAYFGMLIIGLPSLLLLRRMNRESGLAYAALGLLGGTLMPKVWGGSGSIFGEPWRMHGAIAGAIVMSLFWVVARKPSSADI